MRKLNVVSIAVLLLFISAFAFAENVDELKKKNEENLDKNRISSTDSNNKEIKDKSKHEEKTGWIKPDTLVNIDKLYFSGYGGPVVKYTRLSGENNLLLGGRGGCIVNDSFVFGAGGFGSAIPISRTIDGIDKDLHIGFGGFLFEYFFFPKSVIHFSFSTLIGAGGAGIKDDSHSFHNDPFFVLNPEINLFVNITDFFKIGLGADYRFVQGINSNGLRDSDLRGFSVSLIFAFGKF